MSQSRRGAQRGCHNSRLPNGVPFLRVCGCRSRRRYWRQARAALKRPKRASSAKVTKDAMRHIQIQRRLEKLSARLTPAKGRRFVLEDLCRQYWRLTRTASELNSRIASISDALGRSTDGLAGTTVSQGGPIKQPLGLAIAPKGDILQVNGADGKIVETTPAGVNIDARSIDLSHTSHAGAGTLFGLAIAPNLAGVYYVDDGNNMLNILE